MLGVRTLCEMLETSAFGFLQRQPNNFSSFSTEPALVVADVGIPHPFMILQKISMSSKKIPNKSWWNFAGCQGSSWHHKHCESFAGTPPSTELPTALDGGTWRCSGETNSGEEGRPFYQLPLAWSKRTPSEKSSCRGHQVSVHVPCYTPWGKAMHGPDPSGWSIQVT